MIGTRAADCVGCANGVKNASFGEEVQLGDAAGVWGGLLRDMECVGVG